MNSALLAILLCARFSLTRGNNEAVEKWNSTMQPANSTRRDVGQEKIRPVEAPPTAI
jgi:hypothetical protein